LNTSPGARFPLAVWFRSPKTAKFCTGLRTPIACPFPSPQWGTVTGYVELWHVINYTPVIRRELGWNGYQDTRSNGIIPLVGISCEF
jgi:hypothetical protein